MKMKDTGYKSKHMLHKKYNEKLIIRLKFYVIAT